MITKRQDLFLDGDSGRRYVVCDKSCQTAYIIKWSVLLALFGILFLWLVVGYWHARQRLRKGLQPMGYHKWLAPRRSYPPQNNYAFYNQRPNNGYGMQNYQEPPPMYTGDLPPSYQPPPGGSKVAPQQTGVV